MSMYSIIELDNKNYQCVCRVQDGTERWKVNSKAKAIRDLIKIAKILNGTEITKADIHFEYHIPHFTSTESEGVCVGCSDLQGVFYPFRETGAGDVKGIILCDKCSSELKIILSGGN